MAKGCPAAWVVAVLLRHGFVLVSQKGSHAKYRKMSEARVLTVIVPMHKKDIPHGTFRAIVRQAELSKEDFDI